MKTHSEDARQWIHVGSASFAFLLRFLTPLQAGALAATAIVFNAAALPRVAPHLYRPADRSRGFTSGIVLYPIAVLLLILSFRERLDCAAAGWGILAFGDGAATLAGRRWGVTSWPWNREKTVVGTMAFMLCGGIGGVLLAWWTRSATGEMSSSSFIVCAPLAAAVVAAFVETIPIRLDDNISVPAAAGGVLWLATLVTAEAIAGSRPDVIAALPRSLLVNGAVAIAGFGARVVSRSGAIVGAMIGVTIYACAGGAAWLLLFATFLVAAIASRLGLTRKTLLGIEEGRGGRRGAGNAIANCGVAAIAAVMAVATPNTTLALLALAAALTAAGSDTVASEVGKAYGRSTFLVTSGARVKPGTPGAMSLEGTSAGLVAAVGLAAFAAAAGQIRWTMLFAVVAGATVGALVESLLGATLEAWGILNNDVLNFINTATAAGVAVILT